MSLDRLFRPRSIAVYGGAWGDYVEEQCLKLGFSGKIWRVHPNRPSCYRNTAELPETPDSAFLGMKSDLTIPVVKELSDRGTGGAVIFASGFAEVAEGQEKARRLASAAGDMPFIGPNCYGYANLLDRVSMWPDQVAAPVVDRGVAFVCQSGTVSITLMCQRRSLPVGYVITVGNQQRLSVADIIRHVALDERITAIGLYLEGIPDLNDFIAAIDQARQLGKPVVAVKVGSSSKAQATAFSHTGALTGSNRLYDHLFERIGIARCDNLGSMVETLKLLHCYGPMPSNRLAVMGASGGDMSMVSDIAERFDIDFPTQPAHVVPELEASTGPGVSIDNPFDFHTYTWFDYDNLKRMFDAMLRADYALVAFMLDPPDENLANTKDYDVVIRILKQSVADSNRNAAMLCSLPESLRQDIRLECLEGGVAPMQGLPEFLEAFQHSAHIGKCWNNWDPVSIQSPLPTTQPTRVLSEPEGKVWLANCGLLPPPGQETEIQQSTVIAESIGYPVVMKSVSDGLVHKTEQNAVRLNLVDSASVAIAAKELAVLGDRVLVESMITDTVAEMIIGVTVDDQFGLNITIGAGGIFAELHRDSACLLPPFSRESIAYAIQGLRCSKLLDGWRGKPAADKKALIDSIEKLAEFAQIHLDQLVELDINPLLVRPEGLGVVVADTLIKIKEPHDV
ncbi:MAG: acyl-CoA synthetase (NDP forming) [Parasphingorhabdus sp.]|jgi:acyl-CoA synthetase (NDP forming)